MLWICRECGHEVEAKDPVLVTTIGWTALDGDTGICAPCGVAPPPVHIAERVADLIERSDRAIASTHARIAQSRRLPADEPVDRAARRLGFAPATCPSCAGDGGDAGASCAPCEGDGKLWQRGAVILTRTKLRQLAMRRTE